MPPELVFDKDGRRVVFALEKDEVTIGRHPRNDLVLDLLSISRKHARLTRGGDGWRVEDRGSLKGTRLNDQDSTDRRLRDGDVIFLGNFPLTFRERSRPDYASGETSGREFGTTSILSADQLRKLYPGAAGGAIAPVPTASDEPDPLLSGRTVIRSTIDFSQLAAAQPQARPGVIDEVPRLQRLLSVVTQTSAAVLASRSKGETFRKVLDLIFDHLPVERGAIMLWDAERNELQEECVRDESPSASGSGLHFSRTIADKVIRDKVAVLTTDALSDDRFAEGASVIAMGIRSAMAAPLWAGDRVEGLIYVDSRLAARAFDNFDLDLLSALGNHLAVALEQSRLQQAVLQQEVARRRLERYHSPAVVELITRESSDPAAALAADERDVTVMFADVVGFTARCEKMDPREIAALLNRYFSEMAEMVFRHDGTLDKFIGDCLMCVFGAPLASTDHARRAVAAALDMREALNALNAPLPESERLQFRVGMHSGKVVAGDIGSVRRSDYTVLGATVNVAARLESAVARPGQIVISELTRKAAGEGIETRPIGLQRLKGIERELLCFEVVGLRA